METEKFNILLDAQGEKWIPLNDILMLNKNIDEVYQKLTDDCILHSRYSIWGMSKIPDYVVLVRYDAIKELV